MRVNADCTLYNKYIDPTTHAEKYQRALVIGVAWENRKAVNTLRTGGRINADQATVFIPFARGANYLTPKAWQALTTRTGKWTIQEGDLIVKGLVSDEIRAAAAGPPVVTAFTASDLRKKYDDVLAITSVDTMDAGSLCMQHWKVGAN